MSPTIITHLPVYTAAVAVVEVILVEVEVAIPTMFELVGSEASKHMT